MDRESWNSSRADKSIIHTSQQGCFHTFVYRTGGEWLICDMYRGESLFELDPSCQVSSIVYHTIYIIIYLDVLH